MQHHCKKHPKLHLVWFVFVSFVHKDEESIKLPSTVVPFNLQPHLCMYPLCLSPISLFLFVVRAGKYWLASVGYLGWWLW